MENPFNIVTVAFLLGSTQGLFLALLLYNKPGNKTANRFLAALMISYSVFIADASLSGTPITMRYPHLIALANGVIFLIGPLHYLYTRSLISPNFAFSKKQLLHFIPFASFYLYFLFPFYLKSGAFKIAFVQGLDVNGPTIGILFYSWAIIFQGITYMVVNLKILKKHSLRIKDNFSSLDRINLNWLRNITLMALVIWVLGLVVEILQLYNYATSFTVSVPIAIAILIYTMGYLGLKQPEIFSGTPPVKELKKYERSGLTNEKSQELYKKLLQLMESQKPFTDSNLKLNQLAHMLKTSPNHLSQVINEECQQNFFNFINGFRIEEAKRMILDSSQQQLTLLSIAYDVGFNSKSAFNTAFKNHTRTTPSQFRQNASKKTLEEIH